MTDGSVGVDDLLNPSSYSPKIVKSGTLSLTGSSQPGSVKISGLTSDAPITCPPSLWMRGRSGAR